MTWSTTPLDSTTWALFADLIERNNGIYGGCWCMGFHPERVRGADARRDAKLRRVRADDAHASLVLDADGAAQGWAQWGSAEELDGIKHRRVYDKQPPPVPDWRIACVFVDKGHRGLGIARLAVADSLTQIAGRGGGLVEAIAAVTEGRSAQGRFLFSATAEVFDSLEFERIRQVGKHAWVMQRSV